MSADWLFGITDERVALTRAQRAPSLSLAPLVIHVRAGPSSAMGHALPRQPEACIK